MSKLKPRDHLQVTDIDVPVGSAPFALFQSLLLRLLLALLQRHELLFRLFQLAKNIYKLAQISI